MKRLILLAPALLLLGAFADTQTGTIQPGQWETTTRFTSFEAPGIPEQAARDLQAHTIGQPQTETRCITPADAADPLGDMMGARNIQNCQFSEAIFSGGRIHVRGICPGSDEQSPVSMLWEGSYTDTSMDGNFTTEIMGDPPPMRMSGTIASRRIGDCPGS